MSLSKCKTDVITTTPFSQLIFTVPQDYNSSHITTIPAVPSLFPRVHIHPTTTQSHSFLLPMEHQQLQPFTTPDPAWHARLSSHHSLLSTHLGFTRLYSTCITHCNCASCNPGLTGCTSKGRATRCQDPLGRRREERYKARWGWLEEWGVGRGMRIAGKRGGVVVEDAEGGVQPVGGGGMLGEETVLAEAMDVRVGDGGCVGVEAEVENGRGVKRRRENDGDCGGGDDDGVTADEDGAMREGDIEESVPVQQANEQGPEEEENQGQHLEKEKEATPASPQLPPRPPSPKRVKRCPSQMSLESAGPNPNPPPSNQFSKSNPSNQFQPTPQLQPQPQPQPSTPQHEQPPPPLQASTPPVPPQPQRTLRRMRTRTTTTTTTTPKSTSTSTSTSKRITPPLTKPRPPPRTRPAPPTPNKRKQPHPHSSPTHASSAGKTYKTISPPPAFLFYRPPPPRLTTKQTKKTTKPPTRSTRRKSLILADGDLDLDGLIRLCNRAAARRNGRVGEQEVLPEGRRWLKRNLRVTGGASLA